MLPVARGFDSSYGPWLGDWDQYRHTIIGQHPYSGIHPRGGVGLLEDENPDGERPPKRILTLQISAQEALTSAEIDLCGAGIPNNQTHTIDFQFHETGGSFTNVHGPRPIEPQFSSLLARTLGLELIIHSSSDGLCC